MVSTRAIKVKFLIGERVLCYEPDPTKAKVLYDSKVLDVVVSKDDSGKKSVEYLIHFQGWNSSWDRRVGEEFVLKDTVENRQLQKDLAEKAQLQLGAYLYRKERKKHTQPKPLDSEDGSTGSPARIDTDENQEMSSSSDEYSSLEDDTIHIEIIPELREILEVDYCLINVKKKRLALPVEPNVISILELYYRHYVTNQFCGLNEKPNSRYRNHVSNREKLKPEDIQRNLTLCREVLDGLRTYFDFALNEILLYSAEKGQFSTKPSMMQSVEAEIKSETKMDNNHTHNEISSQLLQNSNHNNSMNGLDRSTSRRRTLRSSNRVENHSNGTSTMESVENNGYLHPKPGSSTESNNSDVNAPMSKALSWRLLPEYVYNQSPPPPCLTYGAIHFARLFVKLGDLLTQSSIPDQKMKIILNHVDSIIDFLNDHKEWYGEKYYVDA